MNYGRVVLAGLAGTVAYFVCGGMISGQLFAKEYKPYECVYRSREAIMTYFPMGIAATLIAIVILAAIYAKGYEGGSGALEGLRFGALIGAFIVFAVVADEFVTLNIGARLAAFMAVGRFTGWLVTGLVIGLVYKPASASPR
jgi:membrane protease YdiL (CAAX protease family)